MQVTELDRFRNALERIASIEDLIFGGDWKEIEEARNIAIEALGGELPKVPPGRWIPARDRLPEDHEMLDGRVAAVDEQGYAVTALRVGDQLISSSGVDIELWMALPPVK